MTPAVKWGRSSKCSTGGCVEVAQDGERVLMRTSKDPNGLILQFDHHAWGEMRQLVAELDLDDPTA